MSVETRFAENNSGSSSSLASWWWLALALLVAGGGLWILVPIFDVPKPDQNAAVVAEIKELCPEDQLLASRMAADRLYPALEIARKDGFSGLRAVDLFGDDAVYLFNKNRKGFLDLIAASELEGSLFASSVGPWRKAVVEWAMAGTLSHYLSCLHSLPEADRDLLSRFPQSAALLTTNAPKAKAMLEKHGLRAWHLFLFVDFSGPDTSSVERVAQALDTHGEVMLDVNEQCGLTAALMFVPPVDDHEAAVPRLFSDAVARLGTYEAAALFLTNYEDVVKILLKEKRPGESVREAIDFLAGQPDPEVRGWVSDSPHSLRLLLEKHGSDSIGESVFRSCGPHAANLLYGQGGFGKRPDDRLGTELREALECERTAALLMMKHEGWPACLLLHAYRGEENLTRLLRRPELHGPKQDPLIARIARKLAKAGPAAQDRMAVLAMSTHEQLLAEQYPRTATEEALEWVPGYVALKVSLDLSRGYHVGTADAAFAIVDAATFAVGLGKILGQAVKISAKEATKQTIRKAASSLERRAAGTLSRNAPKKLSRETFLRIPGAMLAFVRTSTERLSQLSFSTVCQGTAAMGKRVGVNIWGASGRRVMNHRGRSITIDFSDASFKSAVGVAARDELLWNSAAYGVGEAGPWLMEQVLPKLRMAMRLQPKMAK
jgi:hypothetical protein